MPEPVSTMLPHIHAERLSPSCRTAAKHAYADPQAVHCRPSGPDISPISLTPPDNLVARYQGPISARFSFLGAPRYRASAAARFSPDFQTSPDFRPISYSILTRFSPDFQARFLTRFSLDFQTSPDSHSIFKHHPILTRFSSPISHSILTRF